MADEGPRRRATMRGAAHGAGQAMDKAMPATDDGLGPVGEAFVRKLMDDTDNEHQKSLKYMLFSPEWRVVIRWFTPEKLERLKRIVEVLDDDQIELLIAAMEDYAESQTMRRVRKRVWGVLIVVVPIVFASAQWILAKAPLIRDTLKLVAGG